MGTASTDRSVATRVANASLLSQTELEILYLNGIPRRYVDNIADTVLRHPATIKLGGDDIPNANDLIADFDEYIKNLEFRRAYAEVVKLQRLYGGALLVLLIDDGLPPEEPVDPKRIRAVRGLVPLSRHEVIPEDFTIIDYSKPQFYRVSTSQRMSPDQTSRYVDVRIHASRVARFDGLYLPWNLRVRNVGWGQSVLQLIWDAFKRYESGMMGLETMLTDADLFVHSIPGLFNRIAAGNESDIRKRLEANILSRSMYKGMVIDKEETVTYLNRALNNISSATDPFIKDLQAATGWPSAILMGESPGGLGKEGRFEERLWASLVENWQELYCMSAVEQIFSYILASKEGPTRGRPPRNWSVSFPSAFTETDKEKADIRAAQAQIDNTYINLGVLNPIEVREARFGGTDFNTETTLNSAVTEQLSAAADASFESRMMGYQNLQLAAQQPPEDQPPPPEDGAKTDAFDHYEAHGLRIRVTHRVDDLCAGYLVGPDGQRTDSSQAAPMVVFGPHRARAYKLYRARFDRDGELIDGPYATGFASLRAAKLGISRLFRQNVAGLSAIPESEIESLRAGWEVY
jgi:phage-related protein (TIGR01555 family)